MFCKTTRKIDFAVEHPTRSATLLATGRGVKIVISSATYTVSDDITHSVTSTDIWRAINKVFKDVN
jgi:hypothetical protein